MANPFDYQHAVTEALFVNRKEELRSLLAHCQSNSNVLLVAPRRIGKSSLIRETFRRLPARGYIPVYVDILKTLDEGEVAQKIITGLGRAAFGPVRRGWYWLIEQLQRFRPVYTLDPRTGLPSITFQMVDPGLPSLEQALELLEATATRRRRRVVLAIDEFQVLLEFPGAERVPAAMRTIIQHQRHVSYLFSGSKAHVLLGLVKQSSQPFWGQLDVLEITGIPVEHFSVLTRQVFRGDGRTVTDPVFARISELCRDNPKRIQEVLFGLFERSGNPSPESVTSVVEEQVTSQRHRFEELVSEVREGTQKRLLVGLAREGGPVGMFGKSFLTKYRISSSAHVQRAVRALQDRGILDRANRFADPYLEYYLKSD